MKKTVFILMTFIFNVNINAQTLVNWVNQVTHNVFVASTPNIDTSYHWYQEPNATQGVGVSLMATEVSKIYLEQGSNNIRFVVQTSTPFYALELNINNGGYNSIYSGSGKTFHVWTGSSTFVMGNHNLKVRFLDLWGTYYYREYDVSVIPKSDALYMDSFGNTMRVWKGNNTADPTPLVLSEGFDPYNTKPEQYYRHAGNDLINCLLTKGFDVYVVNYRYNAQSIRRNSAVFQSAIRYISNINGGKEVAATGMSMGGVINRYACAKAEQDGNPLPISVFMTLDAPLQGAVISQPFQDWRKNQLDAASQNGYPDPFGEYQANNDAAKELLNYNAYDPSANVHSAFYNDLYYQNGNGYPHSVKKIGVSFSTNTPNPNSGQWLYVDVSGVSPFPGKLDFSANLTTEELVAGSYLPRLNVDGFPAVADGINTKFLRGLVVILAQTGLSLFRPITNPWVTITQYKNPTFIPHNSSLDIVNGVSKFDKVLMPSTTGFHDVVPSDLIEPIVNALLEKNTYIQNKTYNNVTKTIISRGKIYAGNNVNSAMTQGDVVITSNSDITFIAQKEIVLKAGFEVHAGSTFHAKIDSVYVLCNGSTDYQNRVAFNPDSTNNEIELQSKQTLENNFAIVPNPNEGEFKIVLPNSAKQVSVSVTNLLGISVCEQTFSTINEVNINLKEKAKGLYLVKVNADSKIFTSRVIVD